MAHISKHNETILCPSCSERIHVGIEYQLPAVVDVFSSTQESIAKADCLRQLALMNIDDEIKEHFRSEVSKPDTFIGPGDVKIIIGNAKAMYDIKVQSQKLEDQKFSLPRSH